MLKTTKNQWMNDVIESMRHSDIVSIASHENTLEDANCILVTMPFFDSVHITGAISDKHRERLELEFQSHRSEEREFQFRIRPHSKTFRKEIVGIDIIEKILADESLGDLTDVIEYTVSNRGIEIICDSLAPQPYLFDRVDTSVFKLYKTTRLPTGNYKFIFRQMGSSTEKLLNNLSRNRIQRITWSTRANCVNCSEFNSITYAPATAESEFDSFTFQCNSCDSEWNFDGPISDRIDRNQTRGLIECKFKQFYQTAVGSTCK